jgi:hypothetical protein
VDLTIRPGCVEMAKDNQLLASVSNHQRNNQCKAFLNNTIIKTGISRWLVTMYKFVKARRQKQSG